jgi:hypothetical protein
LIAVIFTVLRAFVRSVMNDPAPLGQVEAVSVQEMVLSPATSLVAAAL